MTWAEDRLWLTLRTVSRPNGDKGFVVLPCRWKVERTLGWVMNARRSVHDYERLSQHSEAHPNWALITVMTKRLTRTGPRNSWARKPKPILQIPGDRVPPSRPQTTRPTRRRTAPAPEVSSLEIFRQIRIL
ncbi:transposase [Streptomyces lunaelactis]|nr:transposase [Streptomyces lunaelactis]